MSGLQSNPTQNYGIVSNKGVDGNLTFKQHVGGLNLTFRANYTYAKNKIVETDEIKHRYSYQDLTGMSLWTPYLYIADGLYTPDDFNITIDPVSGAESYQLKPGIADPGAAVAPGDIKYRDLNEDGLINDDDKTFAGSYTPKNTFSFGGSLNWKGFDFSFFFQGVTGNKVYNGLKQMAMNGRNDYGNLISDVFNSWDFDPQGSKYPRLGLVTGSDTNGNYSKFSDIFLEDGDYLRLKNITLGYTLPKSVSRFVGMENGSLRVYMSVDNVCTITGYSGVDPEVGNYGIDRGVYPVSRFFNFGVNINF